MRVIAGTARRLQLKTLEGMDTRPTTDRIKETLFNMIQFELEGASFLDLFAGSGGIGIEALSRGAKRAVFVEQNKKAAAVIRDNLIHTRLKDRGEIMVRDAMTALRILEGRGEVFDYIFMDPPYGKGLEHSVLEYLALSPLAGPETMIVAESDLETSYQDLSGIGIRPYKEKIYKTNKHTFFRKEC